MEMHDDDGFVRLDLSFRGRVRLRTGDPVLPDEQDDETSQADTDAERDAEYDEEMMNDEAEEDGALLPSQVRR